MGTTLFSCKTNTGKVQKIDKVEIIDSVIKKDSIEEVVLDGFIEPTLKKDSVKKKSKILPPPPSIQGITIVETIGKIVLSENRKDSIFSVDEYVRFKKDVNISEEKAKKAFEKSIQEFVKKNFNLEATKNIGLNSGKHKIFAQFIIDDKGNVLNIKVRAPHNILKDHTIETLEKLPRLIPAKKEGKNVSFKYTLPISFVIE